MALNSKVQMAKSMEKITKGKEQKEKIRDKRATRSKIYFLCSELCALCSMLFIIGCASVAQKDTVLALVDGDPITEGDLKYSLTVAHRKEDLSSAGTLDLSHYVNKMIDDKLLVHEARTDGMDQLPEIKQAIEAYLLRESVVRLHKEEIVDKVSITEDEMRDHYRKNYEQFKLGIIEVKSEGEAGEILSRLKNGADFAELVQKFSTHNSKEKQGEIALKRMGMSSEVYNAVSALNIGEYSNVVKPGNAYYILKLLGKSTPPENEFDNVKGGIKKDLRKQKENERSDEYLKTLRAKAKITIQDGLLAEFKEDRSGKEPEKGIDKQPLVEVNGEVLTAGEFLYMTNHAGKRSEQDVINSWIERKLIDEEALCRHYEKQPDLGSALTRYENELLKITFIRRIIQPQVKVTDEVLREYYSTHQKDYMKPARYRIQLITAKTEEDAKEIMDNLQNGADFSWVAKRKSIDASAPDGGERGWITKAELPKQVREIIDTMNTGDISPIINTGENAYLIYKLQDKHKEEVDDFNEVREPVFHAFFNEHMNVLLEKYLTQLKTGAGIKVYDKEIKSLETKLQK
ncbi:MAG: peptidyl-prolyl cis-trans isomerase [Thermodesulfovibrionales bacterium]|jgi:parvulin-like peptidyl-prolyl isomerase